MAVNPEKEKAVELAVSAIEKQFGKGSIMRLGNEEPLIRDIQVISTGSISLDIALGVGGVPRGRIVEIYGPESSGKTSLCLHIVAEALRKLTGTISKSQTCVIFINQIRMKIGVMFGNPETTTGGNALKFYASQRMDIRRIGAIKNGETVVGSRTRVKVVKNKVAPPFKEVEFDIMYGSGISKEGDLVDMASQENILEKSGAWYSFNGERIGQGRENAKDFLRDHPEITKELERRVLEKFGLLKTPTLQSVAQPEEAIDDKRPRVKAVK